jgi:hypothetical protein
MHRACVLRLKAGPKQCGVPQLLTGSPNIDDAMECKTECRRYDCRYGVRLQEEMPNDVTIAVHC